MQNAYLLKNSGNIEYPKIIIWSDIGIFDLVNKKHLSTLELRINYYI